MEGILHGEDVNLHQQNLTESQQIMLHMTSIGERMAATVQEGTSTLITHLNGAMTDSWRVSPNSRPIPPPPPNHIQLLKDQKENISAELQLSNTKRVSLDEEVLAQQKRSRELEIALQKSKAEVKRLNTIIIKGGTPNSGPSDDQIRIEFCAIRETILRLVRTHFQAVNVVIHQHRGSTTIVERQSKWLSYWPRESHEIRNYRAQGAMFEIIYDLFFAKPFFATELEIEKPLRSLEKDIEGCEEISKADYVEWRRRTVAAVLALKKTGSVVTRASTKIQDTLEPAITPAPRTKREQLSRELHALCDKALQLSLVFRQSKNIFKVIVPAPQLEVVEAEMELVALEGKASPPGYTKTLFTVFGGLEKTTLFPGENEETVMLEKSQVVGVGGDMRSTWYSQ